MLSDAFFVPSNSSKCMHGDKDLVASVSGHGKYFNSKETSVPESFLHFELKVLPDNNQQENKQTNKIKICYTKYSSWLLCFFRPLKYW